MGTSGIGGPLSPLGPSEKTEGPTGQVDLKSIRIGSLGELKKVLVERMGEEEGTKLYNQFMKSFAMGMLGQIQQAAERAKKAAKEMRETH